MQPNSGRSDYAGRRSAEVLRTVQARRSGGLCAVDWRSGEGFVG